MAVFNDGVWKCYEQVIIDMWSVSFRGPVHSGHRIDLLSQNLLWFIHLLHFLCTYVDFVKYLSKPVTHCEVSSYLCQSGMTDFTAM